MSVQYPNEVTSGLNKYARDTRFGTDPRCAPMTLAQAGLIMAFESQSAGADAGCVKKSTSEKAEKAIGLRMRRGGGAARARVAPRRLSRP